MTGIRKPATTLPVTALVLLSLSLSGCTSGDKEADAEAEADKLVDFALRYTDAWNSHDAASVASFYAQDGTLTINDGEPAVGRDGVTAAAQGFITAFPDIVVEMDRLTVEGDQVFYHWTFTGTNTGPGGSGNAVRISGYEQWTIGDDGLISRSLGTYDEADYQRQVEHGADSPYLFVWAADADEQDSDFLAVLDADADSPGYGDVLSTIEVGFPAGAHHTEHRMPEDATLFVNGFRSGRSYIIDLGEPLRPRLRAEIGGVAEFSHPHSFERLPNGNVLATFQNERDDRSTTGGLVELTTSGQFVRSASAKVAEFPEIRPYSLLPLPADDLVITTTTDMWEEVTADTLQVWRLSDLALINTMRIPVGPRGDENLYPAEPRFMADGKTLLVNTFNCGLYQVRGIATDKPEIDHLYTFEYPDRSILEHSCALAVTFDDFWIQTVPSRNGLVTLDLGDLDNPREVAYLDLGDGLFPHWIALEPNENRIVVTGFGEMLNRVIMVSVDPATGALSVDREFGIDGVVSFAGPEWPHGPTGPAIPHGTLFSIP